ncbi:MAG: hypothetical protein WDN45_04040 [Caulobacteraceae bacterium]
MVGRTRGMLTKDFGRRQAVDLNALLDEALLFTEIQRKRSSVKVETDYARDLPWTCADPVQIQQVVVNLISNAVDAMKEPVCPQAHPQGSRPRARRLARSSCPSPTPEPGRGRQQPRTYLHAPVHHPSLAAWAWACPSPRRSSMPTAED